VKTALLAAAGVLTGVSAQGFAQDEGPYPEFNTPEWRKLFAVDIAETPLGMAPYELGQGTRYETTLKGELAGLDIGRIFLKVMVSDENYAVDYKMEQRGVARWFSDGEATAQAAGTFGEKAAITSHYYFNHDYDGEDDQQRTELFRKQGDDRYRLWSLPQYNFRQPVSEEMAEGAIDPMAALVALAFTPVPEGKDPCDRRVAVLDGRRRFDLTLTSEGTEEVRRTGPGRFRGEAYKCKINQLKIGGYKEKNRGDIDGEIWLYLVDVPAELRSDTLAYVPVKMVARSGIFGASLQAKRPQLIAADGKVTELY
jgi:hypothetical protein